MPRLIEHRKFYFKLGKLFEPGWDVANVPVREMQWPFKISTGTVLKLGRWGLLLGWWQPNPDVDKLDEFELLIKAISARAIFWDVPTGKLNRSGAEKIFGPR
jgi:hypothetical protein